MKVQFYFDVYPWTQPEQIYAFIVATATAKCDGAIRYKVEVDIPNPIRADETIQAEARKEVS